MSVETACGTFTRLEVIARFTARLHYWQAEQAKRRATMATDGPSYSVACAHVNTARADLLYIQRHWRDARFYPYVETLRYDWRTPSEQ